MAHLTTRNAYRQLIDRLNRFPQGAPPSELLYSILEMLFSAREAELVALLPIRPFKLAEAARRWKLSEAEARSVLDGLAGRAILIDVRGEDGEWTWVLPPPMAGFFEFSMMRLRGDIDQKVLAELFHQYLNVEEDFVRELFATGETQLGRVFVDEEMVPEEHALTVLDYERAGEVVETATHRAVGVCYCRHKKSHLGSACDAPMDICMTFNATASALIRHEYAREVEVEECMDLLQQARESGLVQFGENVQRSVAFICNCCGCCCEAMIAARQFGFMQPVHTTNFIPRIDEDACTGCGRCMKACPVEAMSLVSANDPHQPKKRRARLEEDLCLGCGVCVRSCREEGGLRLEPRAERVITPVDSVHRTVLMAIERGKLQNLIFDNHALTSHRVMAAILSGILRLPPIKRAMASKQMKSRYLVALLERVGA